MSAAPNPDRERSLTPNYRPLLDNGPFFIETRRSSEPARASFAPPLHGKRHSAPAVSLLAQSGSADLRVPVAEARRLRAADAAQG